MYVPRDAPPPGEWEYFKISHHIDFVMQPQEHMEGIYEPIQIVCTAFPLFSSHGGGHRMLTNAHSPRRPVSRTSRTTSWTGSVCTL